MAELTPMTEDERRRWHEFVDRHHQHGILLAEIGTSVRSLTAIVGDIRADQRQAQQRQDDHSAEIGDLNAEVLVLKSQVGTSGKAMAGAGSLGAVVAVAAEWLWSRLGS